MRGHSGFRSPAGGSKKRLIKQIMSVLTKPVKDLLIITGKNEYSVGIYHIDQLLRLLLILTGNY